MLRPIRTRGRELASAAVVVLALSGAAAWSCRAPSKAVDAGQAAAVEEAWGIRVSRVTLTAGGGLVDVRYQVTDPEKAARALAASVQGHDEPTDEDLRNSPLLVDDSTGYAVTEAVIHQTGRVKLERLNPKAGLTYFIIFSNTNGLFRPGGRATLAIGDVRLEHLPVQ